MALDVTADSNIYISALVFAGRPLQFLDAARAGVFRQAISDPLLIEDTPGAAGQVSLAGRGSRRGRCLPSGLHPGRAHDPTIDAVPEDPDDNRVLECAVAGGPTYIVTGDAALLRL